MNLNNLDLNKLRVFSTVVKFGSYSKAAEELGLTKSAISQSMTILEHQIGRPLFQRKGRRLFPTQEACELSREFELYQDSLQQVLNKVIGSRNEVEGLIRVGSYYEFAKAELLKRVQSFCTRYPNVKFKLTFDSPSRLQTQLERGMLDLNFSIFSHRGRKDIESKKIFKQELVLVSNSQMSSDAAAVDSLLSLPLIEYYSNHQLIPRWIRLHFQRQIKRVDPRIYAASAEMLLELVHAGLGVGVVPSYIINKERFSDIRIIRPTERCLEDHIWLNQFRNQFDNSAHRAFFEFITNQVF